MVQMGGNVYPAGGLMDEEIMPIEQLPINYYYVYTEEGYARDEVAVAKNKKKSRRPISKFALCSNTDRKKQETAGALGEVNPTAKPEGHAVYPKAKGLVSSKVYND